MPAASSPQCWVAPSQRARIKATVSVWRNRFTATNERRGAGKSMVQAAGLADALLAHEPAYILPGVARRDHIARGNTPSWLA